MNYNQMKLMEFISALILVIALGTDIAAKAYLPAILLDTIVIITMLFYCISSSLFSRKRKNSSKVLIDELSKENEAKAEQFTFQVIRLAIFIGIVFTKLTQDNISLNYDVLFCAFFVIIAIGDGYYLFLEKKGFANDEA